MSLEAMRTIFAREIGTLRREVEAYASDEELWREASGIANPGGTLALHLAGNLRHFVGAVLGATGYARDRDAEFARRDVPRAEVLAEIDAAARDVDRTLAALDAGRLDEPFPEAFRGERPTVGFVLLHLLSHLDYHLGQVDYHRRLTCPSPVPLPVD